MTTEDLRCTHFCYLFSVVDVDLGRTHGACYAKNQHMTGLKTTSLQSIWQSAGSFKGKVRGSNVHEEFFLTPRLGEIVYDIFLIVVMNILHLIY